jgi:hypothetical protein
MWLQISETFMNLYKEVIVDYVNPSKNEEEEVLYT